MLPFESQRIILPEEITFKRYIKKKKKLCIGKNYSLREHLRFPRIKA